MKSLIFIIKIIITGICSVLFFQKMSKVKLRKVNIKWILKNLEESKVVKMKMFRQLKLNCYKLGLDFQGIEWLILILGIISAVIVFGIVKLVFKINSVALILSIPFVFSGVFVIQYFADKKQEKLEEVMNDFFIQFRGEIKVNNESLFQM